MDTKHHVIATVFTCPLCEDTIVSRATHDMHSCSCGAVSIDGGFEYLRGAWDPKRVEMPEGRKVKLPYTKKELYEDWANGADRLGVFPKGTVLVEAD